MSATELAIFKPLQITIIFIFGVFISDIRKKKDMIPLINTRLTLALKMSYLVPIIIYCYTLVIMDWISPVDWTALAITSFGTLLSTKAKLDLGNNHSWTG
jgi:hypothetical protein